MKKLLPLILGATAVAIAAAPASAASIADRAKAQLARDLEGRVAGEPVRCIDLSRVRSSRIIPGEAIVYDAGSTIYVNRPSSGAESLSHWDKMLTRTHSSRLCSIDTVQLFDNSMHGLTGIVFLGEFVPYRRATSASRD